MRFDIDPKPNENQRACVAIARAVLPTARSHLIIIWIVAAIFIAAMLLTPATTGATAMIGVVAIILLITLLDADNKRRLRVAHARDPHLKEMHALEVSDAGVRMLCERMDVRFPWTDLVRVIVTPEFVLFACPSGVGLALPQRVTNPETVTALLAQVNAWAPQLDIRHSKR